jgi:probable HAF family extracellular repeat protein
MPAHLGIFREHWEASEEGLKMKRRLAAPFLLVLLAAQPVWTARADGVSFHGYRITVLADIPGAQYPSAVDINSNCDILIRTTLGTGSRHHSYVWSDGELVDIGSLGGTSREGRQLGPGRFLIAGTYAHAINDRGHVVGRSETTDGANHAFLWQDGKMTDLGTLGGTFSGAWDINNAGQVVGWADSAKGERRAFLWDAEHGMQELGTPGLESHATAINDSGQILAHSLRPAPITYFLWHRGEYVALDPTPPTGFGAFQAMGLNGKGDVIGGFHRGGPHSHESRSFLCSDGKMVPVEPPEPSQAYNALGLTSAGLVVGNALNTPTGQHAFIWQDGQSMCLNDLLPPGTGWDIYFTRAVNEKGEIAACGLRKGKRHVVLLSPVGPG